MVLHTRPKSKEMRKLCSSKATADKCLHHHLVVQWVQDPTITINSNMRLLLQEFTRDLATKQDVSDVKAKVEAHDSSIHNRESSSVIIPYAAIRGTVHPLGKVISSTYSPDQVGVTTVSGVSGLWSQPSLFQLKGVIQRVLFREHKRHMSRTGFWIDTEKLIHQYTNDAPFCLSSSKESVFSLLKPCVEVQDWSDSARIDLGKHSVLKLITD